MLLSKIIHKYRGARSSAVPRSRAQKLKRARFARAFKGCQRLFPDLFFFQKKTQNSQTSFQSSEMNSEDTEMIFGAN